MTTLSQIKELEKDIKNIYATITAVTNQFHDEMNAAENKLNQISWQIKSLQEKAKELEKTLEGLEKKTVSRVEFLPVKSLIFSLAGAILLAAVAAIMKVILK
jgi:archaellum component FlaC